MPTVNINVCDSPDCLTSAPALANVLLCITSVPPLEALQRTMHKCIPCGVPEMPVANWQNRRLASGGSDSHGSDSEDMMVMVMMLMVVMMMLIIMTMMMVIVMVVVVFSTVIVFMYV